jgi:hypothetical protein
VRFDRTLNFLQTCLLRSVFKVSLEKTELEHKSLRIYYMLSKWRNLLLLWNLKVQYYVYKSCPMVCILSQIFPVGALPSYFKIHFNTTFPPTCRSSKWPALFRFPSKNYINFSSIPCMLYGLPISFLNWTCQYWEKV